MKGELLVSLWHAEYVTKDVEDTPFDARSVNDRNATTLFLTEMFRGMRGELHPVVFPCISSLNDYICMSME